MAINTEVTEVQYTNVLANNTIYGVAMPTQQDSDIVVYYGNSKTLVAVQNVDYTVARAVDGSSFDFTPKASLITKIGVANDGNIVFIRRAMDMKNDLTDTNTFLRSKLVAVIDGIFMRLQQINNRMRTAVDHNITISNQAPSGGSNGDIWFKV